MSEPSTGSTLDINPNTEIATVASSAGSPQDLTSEDTDGSAPRDKKKMEGKKATKKSTTKSKKRSPRRRDGDPVHVLSDHRVTWYPSGTVGVGRRRTQRCGSGSAAHEFAANKRAELRRSLGHGKRTEALFVEVMKDLLDHLEKTGTPRGTTRQYRSTWNTWVLDEVGLTPCNQLVIADWSKIFDNLNGERASEGTIRPVARTLNAVISHGLDRGFWEDQEPFGLPARRKLVVKRAITIARKQSGSGEKALIEIAHCPTRSEVETYARAMEAVYPGYGERPVMLAYATGMRICELLALQIGAVRFGDGQTEIDVDWQLDRHQPWPAVKLPKGEKRRVTIVWKAYEHVLQSLVEDAETRDGEAHGFLFPPLPGVTAWADKAGRLARDAAEACEWKWRFHWLRHAWASISMAPAPDGYGLDPVSVSRWLGHAKLTTTFDIYRSPLADDAVTARRRTGTLPR